MENLDIRILLGGVSFNVDYADAGKIIIFTRTFGWQKVDYLIVVVRSIWTNEIVE